MSKIIKHGFHKMIQNLFVMKTNYFLKAKAGRGVKSVKGVKPPPPKAPQKRDRKAEKHASKASMWKKISIFGAFPTIGGVAAYVYLGHQHEEEERPPFVKYEYLRIRNKRYPWGDGNKTFFHNPKKNPLPDGYEDEM